MHPQSFLFFSPTTHILSLNAAPVWFPFLELALTNDDYFLPALPWAAADGNTFWYVAQGPLGSRAQEGRPPPFSGDGRRTEGGGRRGIFFLGRGGLDQPRGCQEVRHERTHRTLFNRKVHAKTKIVIIQLTSFGIIHACLQVVLCLIFFMVFPPDGF